MRGRTTVVGLILASSLAASAHAVPFGPQRSLSFYTLQLRGVSYDPAGEMVEVFVYDRTNDAQAFGHLKITNTDTSDVLFEQTYGDYGSFDQAGTFAESLQLPYDTPLQIDMDGQEFSNMRAVLGCDVVASGGTANQVFPSYSTTLTIPNPGAIPFASARSLSFYSLQLRGVSLDPDGEMVEVFVYDRTYDAAAFGTLKITNTETSEVIFEKTYGDYGNFDQAGTFSESLLLPYDTELQIDMSGQEFSNMRILFGSEVVASGGTANQVFPTYSTTVTIPNPGVIPIADQRSLSFYTMQLRGVSHGAAGEEVEVFIYDRTYDAAAFGSIRIRNLDTCGVLFENTYGDYGNFDVAGTFAETFTLPYETPLEITMSGQEFSNMRIVLGDTVVASGGTANNVFPSYSTTLELFVPEPGSALLGLAALSTLAGIARRRTRRS